MQLVAPVKRRTSSFLSCVIACVVILGGTLSTGQTASAIPAFARKYGMPCSACHLGWPMLSPFGQAFKDNGYQLGNDRDAPIFQAPAYWPVTFRITPQWHRESTNRVQVDSPDGTPLGSEAQVTSHGFDYSGLDFHTAGTLAKNFTFYVLPSSDNTGAFHFEAVWARVDNILGSSWLNVKLGKFELDNLLSEKRILTLTNISGIYTNYHFTPAGESPLVPVAIGDNQLGVEWLGHSKDDRTRISASLLSANDGTPGLPNNRGYNAFFAGSHAFQVGSLGLQRVGAFALVGEEPTYYQYTTTASATPAYVGDPNAVPQGVAGTGIGNKSFYRFGLIGQFYVKKFDFTPMFFHSSDNAYLGTNTPANQVLPTGARAPVWNGFLLETHYTLNPTLVLINRYEAVRMSQQSFASFAPNLGNADVLTFGYRYYPFISSRAGFAFHNEFAISRNRGMAPISGLDLTSSSLLVGFDFAF